VMRAVALYIQIDQKGLQPHLALAAAKLTAILDFPTPPFWLNTTRLIEQNRVLVPHPAETPTDSVHQYSALSYFLLFRFAFA